MSIPPRLVCPNSDDAVAGIRAALRSGGYENVLVVHGGRSYRDSGAAGLLAQALSAVTHREVECASGLPEVARVNEVLGRASKSDLVIGVGGGSDIDTAKLIACFSARSLKSWFAAKPSAPRRTSALWAIPTTSGTGAEMTPFATVFKGERKHSVEHPLLRPDLALSIPELLRSQSSAVLRFSALDALTQAIESYWSTRATRASRALARPAIEMTLNELTRIANGLPPNYSVLADASGRAGEAIAITRTTACHAVSYPLTGRFGIAHGQAVAITLAPMMRYVDDCGEDTVQPGASLTTLRRSASVIAACFRVRTLTMAAQRMEQLLDALRVERRLTLLGCDSPEHRQRVLDEGFSPERVNYLPRVLSRSALERMLIGLG